MTQPVAPSEPHKEEEESSYEVRPGAIAMIDALGTKGIWGSYAAADVIKRVESLEKAWEESRAASMTMSAGKRNWTWSIAFISDTIVMGISFRPPMPPAGTFSEDQEALSVLAWNLSNHLRMAALADPVFVYRGAIAYGEYTVHRQFIVGPAIDEAAAVMEKADAGIVWLTPSSKAIHEATPFKWHSSRSLLPYDVPFRDGRKYSTHALSPFAHTFCKPEDYGPLRDRILQRMTPKRPDIDVEIKRQNTDAFLNRAIAWQGEIAAAREAAKREADEELMKKATAKEAARRAAAPALVPVRNESE